MSDEITLRTGDEAFEIDFEQRRVILHHRYEWAHILNDMLLAGWFLTGSIFFFYARLKTAGTWLFVFGSAQMMIGPLIRIAHKLHTRALETPN